MPLFTASGHAQAAAGEITVTYRLWKSPHVTAGKTYATGFGGAYVIETVALVRAADIPEEDLTLSANSNREQLLARVAEHTRATITEDTILYRVKLHFIAQAPSTPDLPLDEIAGRLARLDASSKRGPWTAATLRLIEEQPRTLARRLALGLDWDTPDFKLNVRKLKALGLTLSHPIGYELSPLGQAYLDSLPAPEQGLV